MDGDPAPNPDLVQLVEDHYQVLYRYAYRLSGSAADAEDLTQQAFLTAQKKFDQLRDRESARSWLFTITRNSFLKSLRSQPSGKQVSLEAVAEPVDLETGEFPVDTERIQKILNQMPEEYRTPIILFYFEEFSYKDIAAQLDLPIGTVMSRLARGKSHLRRRLASREPDIAPSATKPQQETPETSGEKSQVGHELP